MSLDSENLVLIGYFAKQVLRRAEWQAKMPGWLAGTAVEEICSAGNCMSPGAPGWIDQWKHNGMWLYDSPELAMSVVPQELRGAFEVFAYRALPRRFSVRTEETFAVPPLNVAPIPAGSVCIGYDAAQWEEGIASFGCSPLSCNGLASEWPVNRCCLVGDLDTARRMAGAFARGPAEPGPYMVVEVWRGLDR